MGGLGGGRHSVVGVSLYPEVVQSRYRLLTSFAAMGAFRDVSTKIPTERKETE